MIRIIKRIASVALLAFSAAIFAVVVGSMMPPAIGPFVAGATFALIFVAGLIPGDD